MHSFVIPLRRPFTAALTILVVAALARCNWEESRELAQWTRTLAQHRLGLPTPIQSPVHDCDHEHGCICRGATIVPAVNITSLDSQLTELLPPAGVTDLFVADPSATSAWTSAIDHEFSVPPISGRQLRARVGSLVI